MNFKKLFVIFLLVFLSISSFAYAKKVKEPKENKEVKVEKVKKEKVKKEKAKKEKVKKEKTKKDDKAEKKVKNDKEVKKPVIITFYQRKCVDCKKQKEVLAEIKAKYSDVFDFYEINMDEEDNDYINLQNKYNVTELPTTVFINSNDGITRKVSGYLPFGSYQKHINKVLK